MLGWTMPADAGRRRFVRAHCKSVQRWLADLERAGLIAVDGEHQPRRPDGGGVGYLVGEGRANEHREPHLVAGDAAVLAWHGDDELDKQAAGEIARILDQPRRAFGTRVTTAVKDSQGRRCGERDAHVWHCSLNLAAEEGPLPDERWARISEEFVEAMGFGGEKRGEREAGARRGEGEMARRRLERVVRGSAAAALDEAEFVR